MGARISGATERALVRVDSGESMYSAASAEGIAYSTIWKAVQRKNGLKPYVSKRQTIESELIDAKKTSLLFQNAFVISDKFARFNSEYLLKYSQEADKLLKLIGLNQDGVGAEKPEPPPLLPEK